MFTKYRHGLRIDEDVSKELVGKISCAELRLICKRHHDHRWKCRLLAAYGKVRANNEQVLITGGSHPWYLCIHGLSCISSAHTAFLNATWCLARPFSNSRWWTLYNYYLFKNGFGIAPAEYHYIVTSSSICLERNVVWHWLLSTGEEFVRQWGICLLDCVVHRGYSDR